MASNKIEGYIVRKKSGDLRPGDVFIFGETLLRVKEVLSGIITHGIWAIKVTTTIGIELHLNIHKFIVCIQPEPDVQKKGQTTP
jgi:hypothetical protein